MVGGRNASVGTPSCSAHRAPAADVGSLVDADPEADLIRFQADRSKKHEEQSDQVWITVGEYDPLRAPPRLGLAALAPVDRRAEKQDFPLAQIAHESGGLARHPFMLGVAVGAMLHPSRVRHQLRVLGL